MRDARPCRHAMATRGGDKQEPDAPPLSFPRAARPPLLDPLPRQGRGIRKRGCATRLPAAMQWPRAREGLRGPARGARRTAALLVLEAAPQATVDRGCHSERSLRSEESTRSDLPAASAQAGQGERDATAKAVSVAAAMQWPRAGVRSRRRTPRLCHSRARCAFFFPSPLEGRGEGEGGRWGHLEPLGASPLCLRLRLRGASPLFLRLRLRSAQDGALILSPGGERNQEKGMRDASPCRHAMAWRTRRTSGPRTRC